MYENPRREYEVKFTTPGATATYVVTARDLAEAIAEATAANMNDPLISDISLDDDGWVTVKPVAA